MKRKNIILIKNKKRVMVTPHINTKEYLQLLEGELIRICICKKEAPTM